MNLKAIFSILGFTSCLVSSLLNSPGAAAMNPNFAVPSVLTPPDGETLFRLYFNAGDLFDNQECSPKSKPTYWTPASVEVFQAEASLAGYAQASNNVLDQSSVQLGLISPDIALTSDIRQYAGVTQGNKRLVLIKGFSFTSASPDSLFMTSRQSASGGWHNQSGHLSDSGSAFRAAYDLNSRRIIYLDYDHLVQWQSQTAVLLLSLG